MSDFYGLNIALTSFYAQRQGLETSGHNISNVNTEGYSRQRVNLQSIAPNQNPSLFSTFTRGGGGVNVENIARIKDAFLEQRSLQEHGSSSFLERSSQIYSRIEGLFDEPSDRGMGSLLHDFWGAWDDVANSPQDTSARSALLEKAQTIVNAFGQAAADFSDLRTTIIDQLDAEVSELNRTAAQIADLNQSIQSATLSGLSPNDLQDQRDQLIMQLAKKVGATTQPGDNGMMNVFLGGSGLVQGGNSQALELNRLSTPVTIDWVSAGIPALVTGGEYGAMLDHVNNVLPGLQTDLNTIASTLVSDVNALHTSGFDLGGVAGLAFFTATAGSEASTLAINSTIAADPTRVAASSSATEPGSGAVALQLAELAKSTTGTDAAYRSFITGIGVSAQNAARRVEVQAQITSEVDQAKQADSGVNLDEEMTNLMMFQRGYEAAAKFFNSIDQVIETLINLGR